jgi:hypothetical protein
MYLFGILTIVFLGICFYHVGNLLEMLFDCLHRDIPKDMGYTVRRIHCLLIRYRQNKRLGQYEWYVLKREINRYNQLGGQMDYFICGTGSENCVIS